MKKNKSLQNSVAAVVIALFGAAETSCAGEVMNITRLGMTEKQNFEESILVLEKNIKYVQRFKEKCGPAHASFEQIQRYYQLQLTPEEICSPHDTDKPNAFLAFPVYDQEGNTFYNQSSREFIQKIKENYDTFVYVARCKTDFKSSLSATPNIELLVISGHGTSSSLEFGTKQDCYPDDYEIKVPNNSAENSLYNSDFAPLREKAVIFLNSCSAAEGGENANNLANYVADVSKRRIIASRTKFGNEIEILSPYPLKLKIVANGQDVTYSVKK